MVEIHSETCANYAALARLGILAWKRSIVIFLMRKSSNEPLPCILRHACLIYTVASRNIHQQQALIIRGSLNSTIRRRRTIGTWTSGILQCTYQTFGSFPVATGKSVYRSAPHSWWFRVSGSLEVKGPLVYVHTSAQVVSHQALTPAACPCTWENTNGPLLASVRAPTTAVKLLRGNPHKLDWYWM